MVNLTFGEQVKIILGRRGMTIKQLAELVEEHTGKPMSRQNMTQKLGRDNFQEQDMRMIAEILGCKFQLSIMGTEEDAEQVIEAEETTYDSVKEQAESTVEEALHPLEREVTIGELADMADEVAGLEKATAQEETGDAGVHVEEKSVAEIVTEDVQQEVAAEQNKAEESDEKKLLRKGIGGYFHRTTPKKTEKQDKEAEVVGDINPYTGKEYKTNSVRIHPKRIGYVQVYDQEQHAWTDMTEWAFLGYQERKKLMLGKDYEPPIYLD